MSRSKVLFFVVLSVPRRFQCCGFFFVRASMVSYVTFVLSIFVSHLPFFGGLGKAVLRDSGISLVYFQIHVYHYENTLIQEYRKFHLQKTEKFQTQNSYILHISAQNKDCGYLLEPPRRGGSNEHPQSMFLSKSKKNNVYPCKNPSFTI